MNISLVAGKKKKKPLTRKWLSREVQTLNEWMEITMDIYRMEIIPACVNHKLKHSGECWEKCSTS